MRQTVTGLVAAAAVVAGSTAPAIACGFGPCSPCGAYASPCAQVTYVPAYSYVPTGCNVGCGGWAYQPAGQYFFVNQGPTYSGPGGFVALTTYHYYNGAGIEGPAVYPYQWSYHRPWHHGYAAHRHLRYGYAPYTYHGRHVLRRYD